MSIKHKRKIGNHWVLTDNPVKFESTNIDNTQKPFDAGFRAGAKFMEEKLMPKLKEASEYRYYLGGIFLRKLPVDAFWWWNRTPMRLEKHMDILIIASSAEEAMRKLNDYINSGPTFDSMRKDGWKIEGAINPPL